MTAETAAPARVEEKFALTSSRHFPEWLAHTRTSLAFTTYQAGIWTSDTVEWLRIEVAMRELFDVAVLPSVRNAASIGFMTDEIQRVISIEED